jgi:iron-sulfur cluster assembly protein
LESSSAGLGQDAARKSSTLDQILIDKTLKTMISLTESAASKVKEAIEKRGRGLGIKIGVKTTGCTGLAYVLEYVDVEESKEISMEHHEVNGINLYVDPEHKPYLYGTTMDWVKKGLNEGFDFINPNEKDRCGCGESFRV